MSLYHVICSNHTYRTSFLNKVKVVLKETNLLQLKGKSNLTKKFFEYKICFSRQKLIAASEKHSFSENCYDTAVTENSENSKNGESMILNL